MKYKIKSRGRIIAMFEFEHDRDVCFDLLDEDKEMEMQDDE